MKKFALVFVSLLLLASGAFAISGTFCEKDGPGIVSFTSNGKATVSGGGIHVSGTYEENGKEIVITGQYGDILIVYNTGMGIQINGVLFHPNFCGK